MILVRKLSAKSALLLAAFLLLGGSAFAGETAVEEETAALSDHSKVAAKEETAGTEKVVEDWMVPVPASDLKDGVYEVNVESSSSMFKITSCTLTVENGEMSAEMTMGGSGYAYVYMGTGEEAAAAADEDLIPAGEDAEGHNVFTVPVEALDAGTDCAAFSKKKEQWYDRTLVFLSSSLPMDAFLTDTAVTAQDLSLADGAYLADAQLLGGSGRASIESPAEITVENGEMTLQVVMSSENYDYMLVDGERYDPVNTEGNSTFLIPLSGMDVQMPVTADTVAMSTPHEIDYTILVDSSTLREAE